MSTTIDNQAVLRRGGAFGNTKEIVTPDGQANPDPAEECGHEKQQCGDRSEYGNEPDALSVHRFQESSEHCH